MIDYYVRLVELPRRVEGVTVPNNDGSFSVYINSLLSDTQRQIVLDHELEHIRKEHFYIDIPVERMERQADGEHINAALHPPDGKIAHFFSEKALAQYIKNLAAQTGARI